jgi:hypothetical protein
MVHLLQLALNSLFFVSRYVMKLRYLSLLLLPFVLGCGGGISTVPVTGKVTKGGVPVPGMGVTLVGVEGTEAMGLRGSTNDQGVFTIAAAGGVEGAPVGKYKVLLIPPAGAVDYSKMGPGGPKPAEKLPEKFTDIAKATEVFTVGTGPNVIEIDTSK